MNFSAVCKSKDVALSQGLRQPCIQPGWRANDFSVKNRPLDLLPSCYTGSPTSENKSDGPEEFQQLARMINNSPTCGQTLRSRLILVSADTALLSFRGGSLALWRDLEKPSVQLRGFWPCHLLCRCVYKHRAVPLAIAASSPDKDIMKLSFSMLRMTYQVLF